MEPIYQQDFTISDVHVDRYGRLRPSMILYFAQEIAGSHCMELALDYDTLAQRRLFWAVTAPHPTRLRRATFPPEGEGFGAVELGRYSDKPTLAAGAASALRRVRPFYSN